MKTVEPHVTFFIESREESCKFHSRGEFLMHHLCKPEVFQILRDIQGRVSVAINKNEATCDSALTALLRELNIQGISVDIWPNMPDQDGYWTHAGNAEKASKNVLQITNGLERQNVEFDNIGLDLEFPIGLMQGGFNLCEYLRTKPWQFPRAKVKNELIKLVTEILAETNYGIHCYELPILGDNKFTKKSLGIPDPLADFNTFNGERFKRVGLVYTSVKPPLIGGNPEQFIKKYSKGKKRVPAIGIVTGTKENPGRALGKGKPRFSNDEEFERDIKAALEVSPEEFFVFALNALSVLQRTRDAIQKALEG